MTTVTGSGRGNTLVADAFRSGSILITSFTDTTIVANNITFTGTGFTYTSSTQGGFTIYQPTGGTITGISTGGQTWSGFSVPLVNAFNAILNPDAFNDLFFSGDDVFNWTGTPTAGGFGVGLYAGSGNDTINISNYTIANPNSLDFIDGGAGTDTINLTGGLAANNGQANFAAVSVEIINLGAGANYSFNPNFNLVTSGNALTINGSALGAGNSFTFSGPSVTGNLTLLGGAGNDVFQGGSGTNVFNGGAGSDTVIFGGNGVTVDLGISGPQSIGGGNGTATFISIENLQGSGGNDTLTGDANNNILMGGGGNDMLDGGAGVDTAAFSGARSNYTIRHIGLATLVSGNGSNDLLHNMELIAFSDQTVAVTPGSQRNDFGADTFSDVLWQKSDGTIVIWNMNAAGAVASSPNLGVVDPAIYSLIGTGDYNGDRKTDILLRNKNDGTVTDWLMNGAAIASTNTLGVMDSNWSLRGSGDFDGDGITDLVWHNLSTGAVQVWLMNASGGAASTNSFVVSANPATTSILNMGDYNGDGQSEILVRNSDGTIYTSDLVGPYIYFNNYIGRMGAAWSLKGSGDFDGDGKTDLLWHKSDGTVLIWFMNANGRIGSTANLGVVDPAVWSLSVNGDYNGDDKADVLLRNADGTVYNWLMNGAAIAGSNSLGTMGNTWVTIPPIPSSPPLHTINDFGNDGRADILWHQADGTVVLWQTNASGGFATTSIVATVDPAVSSLSAVGDFNGDGKADVLLRNSDGSVTEWLMNGATIASTNNLGTMDSSWSLKGAADFNGDGVSDILWQRSNGTVVIWYAGSGAQNLGVSNMGVAGFGDYNGDGQADILLRNTTTGAVSVWFDNGSITNTKSLDPVDSSWSVKGSGDFNGDGITDILWQNSGGFAVIWQMNASGALATATGLPDLNPNVLSIAAVADYNGDGMADILLRNPNGSVANWLMSGATVPGSNNLGSMASSAAVAPPMLAVTMPQVYRFNDYDADGKADMLWHKADGSVVIWQMNGSGTVGIATTVTTVDPALYSLVATGDFNGDGKADVLLQKTDGTVTEWLMNGAAIASTKNLTAMNSSWLVRGTGDFNGDGVTDILWQKMDGSAAFWFMSADGSIASTDTTTDQQYLSVGDYNGDGHADVLRRDSNGWVTSLLITDHYYYAQLVNETSMDSSWQVKGSGDFNGDGRADVLWQKSDGTVVIWQMNASGAIGTSTNLGVLNPAVWSVSGVADYNGDGKADIQLRNANGTVYDWLMNGATIAGSNSVGTMASSALAAPPPFAPPPPVLHVTNDFDGGGKSDMLWHKADGTVVLWQMNGAGSSVTPATVATVDPAVASIVGVGDYNGDGKADLLLRYASNGNVTEWRMNGATVASTILLDPMDSSWMFKGSGDFNGDGFTDLLWQKADASFSRIWFMDALGIASFGGTGSSAQMVSVGDYSGDGKADILLRDPANGKVFLWYMNGANTTVGYDMGTMDRSWSVKGSGDFDGDGKADILWQKSDGTVVIWQMGANAAITSSTNLGVLDPAVWSISVSGDFNGDGKADIQLRNANGTVYDWLMNGATIAGSNSLGSMASSALAIPPLPVLPPPPPVYRFNDFDGSGQADILWHKADGTVVDWQMNGVGSSVTPATVTTLDPALYTIVATGDFNDDGKADVLVQKTDGTVTRWLMNGTAIADAATLDTMNTSWSVRGTGDFNGDGVTDILWQKLDGSTTLWLMHPSGTIAQTYGLGANPQFISVGDYNGDGKADILTRDAAGLVTDRLMNGSSAVGFIGLGTMDLSWQVIGSGDFGGDGKADILWQKSDGTILIWQMNASGAIASSANLGVLDPAVWSLSTVADYNGDGKADILLRNANGSTYDWLMNGATIIASNSLGTMDSSALSAPPPVVTPGPVLHVAGDFDGGGRADQLWHQANGTVVLWQMNGAGRVATTTTVTSVDPAVSTIVGVGDYNGDGKADVVLHNADGSLIEWQMNGATIASTKTLALAGFWDSSWTLRGSGDFDGNGVIDMLWQKPNGSVELWYMDATGFAASASRMNVTMQFISVGDYNGDGKADILTRGFNGVVTDWLSGWDPVFGYTRNATNYLGAMDNSWSVKGSGDFNGDGKADILWQKTDGTVMIWQMNASGGIASSTTLGVLNPAVWSLSNVVDYNGDGKADILLRNADGTTYDWLMNGATIAASNSLGTMASSAVAASPPFVTPASLNQIANDFDGGGKADQLWHKADGTVVLWQMNGAGAVAATTTVTTVDPAVSSILGTGDFNADGKADVLLRNNTNGAVTEWLMNGAAIAGTVNSGAFNSSWAYRGSGDFDGDGRIDILWQKPDGVGKVGGAPINGNNAFATNNFFVSGNWSFLSVGDYNGDGRADILARDANGTVNTWLTSWDQNIGYMRAGINNLGVVDSSWSVKGSGDFNGDGKADVLWQKTDGTVVIWLMNASGGVASGTNLGVLNPVAWSLSGVGDYNGDGKADIELRNANGTIYDWLMNGATISGSNNLGTMASSAIAVPTMLPDGPREVANDFDKNGHSDIIWHKSDGTVTEWLMTGAGTVGSTPSLTAVNPGVQAFSGFGDFNADGTTDILLHNIDGTVTDWLMNGGAIASTIDPVGSINAPLPSLALIGNTFSVIGTGDFNFDDKTDYLFDDPNSPTATMLTVNLSSPSGSSTVFQLDKAGASILGVADFDGNHLPNVLVRNPDNTISSWGISLNSFTASVASSKALGTMDSSWSVRGLGDFGGDGIADILWQKSDGTVVIWQMNATGNVASTTNLGVVNPATYSLLGVGDYNGDGNSDVLLRNNSTGAVYDWLMNGAAIVGSNSLGTMSNAWTAITR